LENGVAPLHIRVEAAMTKGKYDDYHTFLAAQAVQYVRLYLEGRRQGNLHHEIPAEEISDDSPLIRDEMYTVPRPSSEAINLVGVRIAMEFLPKCVQVPRDHPARASDVLKWLNSRLFVS
jgi:hypothetical protein